MPESKSQPSELAYIGYTALATMIIIFIYVIPGTVFVVFVVALLFAIPLAIITGSGAAVMVVGNAILNKAHLSGYTTSAHAAVIGATGACISSLAVGSLSSSLGNRSRHNDDGSSTLDPIAWGFALIASVITSTLTGVIGCAILRHNHVDVGGIDLAHSASAGALGGLVFSFGPILLTPVILGCILIILSPLFVATKLGLQWIYVRSNNTWEQRGEWVHTNQSHCICIGISGDDEEMNAELGDMNH